MTTLWWTSCFPYAEPSRPFHPLSLFSCVRFASNVLSLPVNEPFLIPSRESSFFPMWTRSQRKVKCKIFMELGFPQRRYLIFSLTLLTLPGPLEYVSITHSGGHQIILLNHYSNVPLWIPGRTFFLRLILKYLSIVAFFQQKKHMRVPV